MTQHHLQIDDFGPIKSADLALGELTLLVGPQAAGKSIALQLMKLLLDLGYVHSTLKHFGIDWNGDVDEFMDLYLGEGMRRLRSSKTRISFDGKLQEFSDLATSRAGRSKEQRVFYIPAQRVLSIAPTTGWPRGFTDYRNGDPFVARDFSESLRRLSDTEFSTGRPVFFKSGPINSSVPVHLRSAVFGDFDLRLESVSSQKRFVLKRRAQPSLPFTVWSAGQREIVPLLLGCCYLLSGPGARRKQEISWAVLEEPEMGLHPRAISASFLLVPELLRRGYRVCLSTHSSHVLDLVWALGVIRRNGCKTSDVLELLGLETSDYTRDLASAVLQATVRVYYFDRDSGIVKDISDLDPGAGDPGQAGWGGLTENSGDINDIVAAVVSRNAL